MVAFIGNTLRGKVSGENFNKSIVSRQNSSDFSPIKVLRYMVQQPLIGCSAIQALNHLSRINFVSLLTNL